jgi:class 3 adenylate cyclase
LSGGSQDDFQEGFRSSMSTGRFTGHRKSERQGSFDPEALLALEEASRHKERRSVAASCAGASRYIVDNKYVVFISVVLTAYALIGDDIRLICTDKKADVVFNILTIVCIVFFSAEVAGSCLGKQDYFLGFFFWLDLLATVTLILDITWVNEAVFSSSSDMDLADRARSGRTARLGASVGRMVRVLRLIRIFKLYKAYYAVKNQPPRSDHSISASRSRDFGSHGDKRSPAPGQGTTSSNTNDYNDALEAERWAEEQEQQLNESQQTENKESLVGKKLSGLTTRRVIVLVLSMLLVLPMLEVQDPQTPMAPSWAADMIHQAYLDLEQGTGSRDAYERAVLKIIYYHNWYSRDHDCGDRGCPADYYSHLFWLGIGAEHPGGLYGRIAKTSTTLSASTVANFTTVVAHQDDVYNYGTLPVQVVSLLSRSWDVKCDINGYTHLGLSLLDVHLPQYLPKPIRCPHRDLRPSEWMRITPRMLTKTEYKAFHFAFFFDLRPYVRLESLYGIGITCFVCFVLTISSIYFSSDANRLVLTPVETMITKIEAIRDNPLIAMKMADDQFRAEEVQKAKKGALRKGRWTNIPTLMFRPQQGLQQVREKVHAMQAKKKDKEKADQTEMFETVILEKTIIKLGWLLSLVFGEAGAGIVSHNMGSGCSETAGVNAMIAGKRVECIIGHARIRDFSTATEVLQGKVMTFVNQVAEIVHGVVDQHHGAANQNNGNTFLLIWRIPDGMDSEKVSKLGNMSLVAFAKIFGAIHRSPVLATYRGHPGLQQRLGSNHKVSMTFGLHAGWAIEGAVGSEFKIDASYLSPNVSIAESLERATKQYGVNFLTSQAVTRLCRKKMVSKCRLIDKVRLPGSLHPLELYTLDLDPGSMQVDDVTSRSFPWNVRQRFRARQMLETEKTKKLGIDYQIEDAFECGDIAQLRKIYTFEFLCLFNRGYQNYSQGEWRVAKDVLSQTHTMLQGTKDGPSGALLDYMEASASRLFTAPDGWNGVRVLNVNKDDVADL